MKPSRLPGITVLTVVAALAMSGCTAMQPTPPVSSMTIPIPTAKPSLGETGLYAGTEPAVDPQGVTFKQSLRTADGVVRSYRLFVPDGGLGVAPLLIALHGGLGSAAQFEQNTDFNGLATSNRFIVAYPDGIGIAPDGSGAARTWNGGDCCGSAVKRNVDDEEFLRELVREISQSHAIDPNQVFATGHSNGAIMALRLACQATDVFAAIAVQSAALGIDTCTPQRPISLMQIHGTADSNLPIDGGFGSGVARVNFRPARDAARTIAAADGCEPKPMVNVDASNPDLTLWQWNGCDRNTAVEFLEVAGASHAWMGHPAASPAAEKFVGVPYSKLDSSRAVWSFLVRHPRG